VGKRALISAALCLLFRVQRDKKNPFRFQMRKNYLSMKTKKIVVVWALTVL